MNPSGSSSQQIDLILAFLMLIRSMDAAFDIFTWHHTILRLPGDKAYKPLALGYLHAAASKSTIIGSEA